MDQLSLEQIKELIGDQFGKYDVACPLCGPSRTSPANRKRRVFRIYRDESDFATYHCVRCGVKGWARGHDARPLDFTKIAAVKAENAKRDAEYAKKRLGLACYLWDNTKPLPGTPVETYLIKQRNINCLLPNTLGYLPPRKPEHHPAMIALFGIPVEIEPGILAVKRDAVRGVHLTLLNADGKGKAETGRDKLIIGKCLGSPIVLAPMNDLLGLAITEGIEDALSVHAATGLGAWAAGAAGRMPALAETVPEYTDCVTIVADGDDAGQRGAEGLAEALVKRCIHVEVTSLRKEAA